MRVPEKAPSLAESLEKLDPARLPTVFGTVLPDAARSDRYLHWDELKWRKPPGGVTQSEWWTGLKVGRSPLYKNVFLSDKSGAHFNFCVPDLAQRHLHFIDQNLSGQITLTEVVTNPSTRDRYIVNSLIEEAITSSQLEGASTSRTVAKEMLRSGRSPRDKSEQMILNNFMAMQRVGELRNEILNSRDGRGTARDRHARYSVLEGSRGPAPATGRGACSSVEPWAQPADTPQPSQRSRVARSP